MNLFSAENRRNPYPVYDEIRRTSPVLRDPQSGVWMLFDYASVKRALSDHEAFSSKHGPVEWMIFLDPPRHSKLRALISQAFTPRSVANLERRIRELARGLLAETIARGEMDLAAELSVPLPMRVIAEMLGIPSADQARFTRWNDAILNMSYTVLAGKTGSDEAKQAVTEFQVITGEMSEYLGRLLNERESAPKDDLLTRLLQAEVEGERLTQVEILGFFQLLLLAGSETTTNLINNAVLSFIENPEQLVRLRAAPDLLSTAVEEVLRYRSPLAWMFRLTTRDVELGGHRIAAGNVVLPMIGAANRDPKQFDDPNRFDVAREPNPHVAFGHGIHFCLGAALARLESRVVLTEFLQCVQSFELAGSDPWEPRKGLHVYGPTRLPIRFEPTR